MEKNENDSVITKTWEELADIEAYKKAGKDCCEWYLDSIWTHRTRSAASVEIPSDELVYRTLGVNLDKPYTKAVLESLVESEQHARHDPHFTTVAELLAYADSLDGWKDQQHIANAIEAVRELLKKRAKGYVTEIGKDFHEAFLKALDEMESKWDDKTSDPPSHLLSFELPTKYNILFHGLLERFSEHCLKAYFEVSGEQFDLIIGKPEDIAGHPIERKCNDASVKAPISPMSSFDTLLYPTKPTFTKEEAQEISDGIKKFRNFEKEKAKR